MLIHLKDDNVEEMSAMPSTSLLKAYLLILLFTSLLLNPSKPVVLALLPIEHQNEVHHLVNET